jgi:hypothetical protein
MTHQLKKTEKKCLKDSEIINIKGEMAQENDEEKSDLQNHILYNNMNSVKYIETLRGKAITTNLDTLIKDIKEEYDEEMGSGRNYYEMFDMVNEEWKIHFDFDKKMKIKDKYTPEQKKKYYDKIITKLNFIFGAKNEDWAVSEDSRVTKDSKGKKIYKVSYHFVNINKKTTYSYLYPKIKIINKLFKADGIEFDTSIYRKGITRFRIVCCKKDGEIKSLLKPLTYSDDIKRHFIQDVYACEDLYINDDKLSQIKNSISSSSSIKDILSNYEIVSTSNKNGIKFHNIKGVCPFANREHSKNHFYIVEKEDSLELKCHSHNCCNKLKVLYRKNDDYSLFNVDYFNSIKIPEGKDSNYKERRKYFEKHYVYIRNTDTTYNIVYRKNSIGCYERELMEIKDRGLDSLIYDKIVKDKKGNDVITIKKFYKFYRGEDQTRKNYQICDFIPKNKIDKGIYNLFNGFDYEKVLDEDDEIKEEDIDDLNFLLEFIKSNVCESDDKLYHYFISNLAMIIQHPTFLTHIITLFYSSEEGTGKSSFLKFYSKVLGDLYTFFGSIKDICEKHSTSAVGRLINTIEELQTNKNATEELKNFSQREKAPINDKNKAISSISCYVRYFIASNLRNCISLKRGERRYFIVKFNKINDKTKVDKIDGIYKNKKIIYLFGKYLKNYTLTKEQMKRSWWEENKPNTKTYKLFVNNDNVSIFFKELYNRTDIFSDEWVYDQIKKYYVKKNTLVIPKTELWCYYQKFMANNDNQKYIGRKSDFFNKIAEEHIHYITKKSPKNIHKYYIDLKSMFNYMDMEDDEFINKYSPDYINPIDIENKDSEDELIIVDTDDESEVEI